MDTKKTYWTYQKSQWLKKDLRGLLVYLLLSSDVACDENFKSFSNAVTDLIVYISFLQKKGFFVVGEMFDSGTLSVDDLRLMEVGNGKTENENV